MSEPSRIRHLFGEAPASEIDVAAVIRRSRRRRAPRAIGAGAVGVLALGAVFYIGFASLPGQSQTASDAGGAPAAESMENDMGLLADGTARADVLARCGESAPSLPSSGSELAVSLSAPPSTAAGAASLDAEMTVTNVGSSTVTGLDTVIVQTLLTRGGEVVAVMDVAAAGPGAATLEAGQSTRLTTTVELRDCGGAALAPGSYDLSAVAQLTMPDGSVLLDGASTTVVIG